MNLGFLLSKSLPLVFKGDLSFQFDRIPMRARNLTLKKRTNLFKIGLNRLFPIARALGYPYMAHISPSGICNLDCELCPKSDPRTKGKQLLPLQTFQKFIDEAGDYLIYLILWSWGEPLLNPDIYTMIEYAKNRGILSVTSTNLQRFSREEARRMVASGLDALIVALDGATPETYARLRKGGDFDKVIRNTRLLMEEKRRAGASLPLVNLRMVVSQENENEVGDFWPIARQLEVDVASIKAFSTRQPGYSDPEHDRHYAPSRSKYRWYRYHSDFSTDTKPKKYNCKFPWTKPTLFADGSIISCEFDLGCDALFGNIDQQSFPEIWFGSKAENFRRIFLKNRDAFPFCRDCVYDYKLIPGCVLEWEYLSDAAGK